MLRCSGAFAISNNSPEGRASPASPTKSHVNKQVIKSSPGSQGLATAAADAWEQSSSAEGQAAQPAEQLGLESLAGDQLCGHSGNSYTRAHLHLARAGATGANLLPSPRLCNSPGSSPSSLGPGEGAAQAARSCPTAARRFQRSLPLIPQP